MNTRATSCLKCPAVQKAFAAASTTRPSNPPWKCGCHKFILSQTHHYHRNLSTCRDTDFNYTVQNIFYVSGAGRTMGLNVLMDPETTQSLALAKSAYGIEVLIHDAEEFPQASVSSAIGQPGTEVIMSIVPSVISSKPAIRSVPVQERQCYFADEQTLRAARKYSLNSCLAECRVDYIVAKCDCVPFFYPDLPAIQDKYRQCGLNDVACLRTYRSEYEHHLLTSLLCRT